MKRLIILIIILSVNSFAQGYKNFKVAAYARAREVIKMADPAWVEPRWQEITNQLHVDKIFLETHRDMVMVSEDTLLMVIKYFRDKNVKIALYAK